jgi:thymidylate synthase (FAD)
MRVELIAYTPDPAEICAMAAKGCYSQDPAYSIELSQEQIEKMLKQVIESGHHSTIEHASFTFSVEGVSRALTHQLVRHRIASFSQQSQRYVEMEEPTYVIPPSIVSQSNGKPYVEKAYVHFQIAMVTAWNEYDELIKLGIPPEDARFVLPNACTTNITITMNARELLHFFELRMCNRAQWEIREMAKGMYHHCMAVCPEIFRYAGPKCWTSKCTESKPCGNPPKREEND